MKAKNILIGLLFGIMSLAAAGGLHLWLEQPVSENPAPQFAVVLDSSGSLSEDQNCEVLIGIIHGIFKLLCGEGSQVVIFQSGTRQTGFEPDLVAQEELPYGTNIMEGKEAAETAQESLLLKLVSKCIQMQTTEKTAIVSAMRRALQQLKAMGCNGGRKCIMYVRTDGRGNVESWLKKSLKAGKVLDKGEFLVLNNTGIKVRICGLAEFVDPDANKKKRTDTTVTNESALLNEILPHAFTVPENVILEPICPRGQLNSAVR